MKITSDLRNRLQTALREDIGKSDVTTDLLVPSSAKGKAYIVAREAGVFCGEAVVRELCRQNRLQVQFGKKDGQAFSPKTKLIFLKGSVRSILKTERTLLNLLGHLCGIAAKTNGFVKKAGKVKILDTRKTTPLWRDLEKYAVTCGGGVNHRMGLYDAVFVKENHRKFGTLNELKKISGRFEIEVRNERELAEALMLSPRVILFDNFKPAALKRLIKIARKAKPKIILEASGGVTLENVAAYAKTGVDQISVGSLTHSVKAVDLSLLMV